jgi:hypothetical protein
MPMKTIFDRETEIGEADPERWGWEGGDLPNFELLNGRIMAHTRGDLNHARGILKLEQRVYIRAGEHVLEQTWLPPQMSIESADDEMGAVALAEKWHDQFCEQAAHKLNEGVCAFA